MKTGTARLLTVGTIALAASLCGAQTRLYVAPDGNDRWSGLSRSFDGKNGPKATLSGARDELRSMRGAGTLDSAGAIVEVAPGRYPQLTPLTFGAQDSGTSVGPIVYRSSKIDGAKIDGGLPVSTWKIASINSRLEPGVRLVLYTADLWSLGITDFGKFPLATWSGNPPPSEIELFANGVRQTPARWPNRSYATILRPSTKDPNLSFVANLWASGIGSDDHQVWLCGFPSGKNWAFVTEPATISGNEITLSRKQRYPNVKGGRFYLRGSLAALDAPGEYFVDKEAGRVYWYPHGAAQDTVVSANTGPLLRLDGVHDVTFEGFVLEHSRGDAAVLTKCSHVTFLGNAILRCGGSAIFLADGDRPGSSHDNLFKSNTLRDLGGGGISVQTGNRRTLEPTHNVVENNRITQFGLTFPSYRAGIRLDGVGAEAKHNDIGGCPHSAIIFGGVLGANDCAADANHIWNACQDTSDAGAIYANGSDPTQLGNRITGNWIEDSYCRIADSDAIWAIYLDGQASGFTVSSNRILHSNTALLINGGRDNDVFGNIISACPTAFQVNDRSNVDWNPPSRIAAMGPGFLDHYPKLRGTNVRDSSWPMGNNIHGNFIFGAKKAIYIHSGYGVHVAAAPRRRDEIGWRDNVERPASAKPPTNIHGAGAVSDEFLRAAAILDN